MSNQSTKKGETSSQSATNPFNLNMLREPYVGKTQFRVPELEKERCSVDGRISRDINPKTK